MLQRKTYSSGKLEAYTGLRDRKFCNLQCCNKFNKNNYKNKPILPPRVCVTCTGLIERRGSSRTLCKKCYYIDSKKNKPEIWDQARKRSADSRRAKRRIKKGLPPDHPRLIANYGEGHLSREGYRTLTRKGHANAKNKYGHIYEHILIMSEHLGRPLTKDENVHHKNGIRDDNRIGNLELWNTSQPSGQRLADKIDFYKEFLLRYECEISCKEFCNITPLDISAPSNGKGSIGTNGYKIVLKKGHPNATGKKGHIAEHRWIMSQYLGRPLKANETIHHRNGVKHDNRIENLELWSKSQPCGQRVEDRIKFYTEFLQQYGYKITVSVT